MVAQTTNTLRETLVPIVQRLIDLGSSLLRWRTIWTVNFDGTGTITVPTPVNATDAVNKAYADSLSGAGVITQEVDGAPSFNATTIQFDQADGFVVSNPVGATARLDLAAVPTSALAGPITQAKGGTNIDTSASTGIPKISAGAWTVPTRVGTADGGTNVDTSAATGIPKVAAGAWTTPTLVAVADGGTNLASGTSGGVLGYTAIGTLASSILLTLRGLLLGGGAGATPTAIAALTNGQLPIGSTGADPVPATITAGTNISVVNAAGSITINNTAAAATDPILDRVTADTTVANTITETTIYTFSVVGGTLSTNKRLRLILQTKITDTVGGALTLRFKYGAATVLTSALTMGGLNSQFGTDRAVQMIAMLSGDGATNSQIGSLGAIGFSQVDTDDGLVSGLYLKGAAAIGERGTTAVDSTAAQTLVLTAQWSTASAARSITMEHAVLELL